MIPSWLGILIVFGLMMALFGVLKLFERFFHPHPELTRKLAHVGMGLAVITFPWIFHDTWPVLLLAGGSAIALATMKVVPRLRDGIGSVLTAVHRPSLGEVCFPISVALLTVLSRGDKILYVVPILILTLADAVAALIGITYGKVRYVTSDGFKSAEGSIAFMSIAFLSVHVPLLVYTDIGRTQTLLIAALIALLSMIVEAIAAHGLDNLLIPIGAFAFLKLYQHATIDALSIRLVAAVVLVIFALSWRRRSSLNDSALIAAALFGYGAAMLGGTTWLLGPLVLFLVHVVQWPRDGKGRGHTVYSVAAVTLAGFFWLILQSAYGGVGRFFLPYAVGFGAHLAIMGASRIAVDPSPRSKAVRVAKAILAGWALVVIQMLPLLLHGGIPLPLRMPALVVLAGLAGVGFAAGGFYTMVPTLYGPTGSYAHIQIAGFSTALLASLLVVGFQSLVPGWY